MRHYVMQHDYRHVSDLHEINRAPAFKVHTFPQTAAAALA